MNESDLELYGIVGKMFREIRESKGLSLEVSATYLDIAPKSLQRYECGERKIKVGTIKELCNFYKIKYDDFIKEAKLRFGKNIFTDISSEKEELPEIMQYYKLLNGIGKDAATEQVRLLTLDEKYTRPDNIIQLKEHPELGSGNAAHADDYIHAPEHLKQEEENIMDDENF